MDKEFEYDRYADIKRLKFIIRTFQQNIPEGALVLDVGCGNGIISRGVGKAGYSVLGIDISEKAIEKARSLTNAANVKFDVISAEQLVVDGKRYQAVICSEVLEHLNDPGKLLKVLRESLTDDGILIVTVPNGMGPREVFVTKPIIALQKKDNWAWRFVSKLKNRLGYKGTTIQSAADDLTHIQFFTKRSLYQLAAQNEFEIQKFSKTNFIDDVFPFSLISRKLPFLQKFDAAIADILPPALTGSFVTAWKKIAPNGEGG